MVTLAVIDFSTFCKKPFGQRLLDRTGENENDVVNDDVPRCACISCIPVRCLVNALGVNLILHNFLYDKAGVPIWYTSQRRQKCNLGGSDQR